MADKTPFNQMNRADRGMARRIVNIQGVSYGRFFDIPFLLGVTYQPKEITSENLHQFLEDLSQILSQC